MAWYIYVAYFFAGLFVVNGIPHFLNGVSGRRFQTPFASPPAAGESSPLVNVVWGLVNFAVGYGLLFCVGDFTLQPGLDVVIAGLGCLVAAVALSVYFGRVRSR